MRGFAFMRTSLLLLALAAAAWSATVSDERASPKNQAEKSDDDDHELVDEDSAPVGKSEQPKGETGDAEDLPNFLNDGRAENDVKNQLVNLCESSKCTIYKLGWVPPEKIKQAAAFRPVKGDSALSESALKPALESVEEALAKLQQEKQLIDNLKRETEALKALSASLSKGSQGSQEEAQPSLNAGGQKGNSNLLLAAAAAALSGNRGNANFLDALLPQSKGRSNNAMLLEANVCPLLNLQLSSAQKQLLEAKARQDSLTTLLSAVQVQKSQLETALKISESLRDSLKVQALESAKEAAEEKGKNSLLTVELAKTEAEKKALTEQKAELENQLASTQSELLTERQAKAALADALKKETKEKQQCNEELFTTQTELKSSQNQLKVTNNMLRQSQDQLAAKTQELIQEKAERQATEEKLTAAQQELLQTQESLREKERELGEEQVERAKVQRQLDETQVELATLEEAKKKLEDKKQELEDQLATTSSNLQQVTVERDQLSVQLNTTTAELANKTAELEQSEANLEQKKSENEALQSQLTFASAQYMLEKKAREEQAYLISKVRDATLKVQDDVQKLQLENLQLQQEAQKLKHEQKAALALMSGCPTGYVKKDNSCYKLVTEAAFWKSGQDRCTRDGANLISIETVSEQNFVAELLKAFGSSLSDNQVFVGGLKVGGSFKWLSSGANVGQYGPPNVANDLSAYKPNYDCLVLSTPDELGSVKLVGQQCLVAKPFVCEYSLSPLAFTAGFGKGGASARDTLALSSVLSFLESSSSSAAKGNSLRLLSDSKGSSSLLI